MYRLIIIDQIDNKNIRSKHNDLILYWDNKRNFYSKNSLSIINFIEENSDHIKKIYLDWIDSIGNKQICGKPISEILDVRGKYKAWWHSNFIEKSNYENSPQISDALKLIAVQEWIKDYKIKEIIFYSNNKKLAKCLNKFSFNKKFIFKWKKTKNKNKIKISKSFIKKLLPYEIRAFYFFARKIIYSFKVKKSSLEDCKKTNSKVLFIDYFSNIEKLSFFKGKFKSLYWGELVDKLSAENINSQWLHLTVDLGHKKNKFSNPEQILKKLKLFNQSSKGMQNHYLLVSFFDFWFFLETLCDWFFLRKNGMELNLKKNIVLSKDLDLWPLFEDEWQDSIRGVSAISNCYNFNLFDRAFKKYNQKTKLIYLFEGQSWEYIMIQAWRKNQNGEIIGYSHASICYWDLRKFFSSNTLKNPLFPFPDKVALNGNLAKSLFSFNAIESKNIIELEATRYLYINKYKRNRDISMKRKSGFNLHKKVLLILFDYNEKFIKNQLEIISEISNYLERYYLVKLKPHPAKIDFLKGLNNSNYEIIEDSILSVISDVDFVFTSNTTSAALECFCLGKPVICLCDNNELNLSPLRDVQGTLFVYNSAQLEQVLRQFWSKEDGYQEINNDIFYLNNNFSRWMDLLKN